MREERFFIKYVDKSGAERGVHIRSAAQKERSLQRCAELGFKVLSVVKLYPFSTERNQHNFMLISNVCFNTIHDMQIGELPFDPKEYDRLSRLKERADYFFEQELPVAWLPWKQVEEAKELVVLAVEHRVKANIEAGNTKWLSYC